MSPEPEQIDPISGLRNDLSEVPELLRSLESEVRRLTQEVRAVKVEVKMSAHSPMWRRHVRWGLVQGLLLYGVLVMAGVGVVVVGLVALGALGALAL